MDLSILMAILFSTTVALQVAPESFGLEVHIPESSATPGQYSGIAAILLLVLGAAVGSIWRSHGRSAKDKEKTKLLGDDSLNGHGDSQQTLEEARATNGDWKCMACACMLGTINNNAYSTVVGASQPLAQQFGMQDYMSLFATLLLAACLGCTIFNSAMCLKIGIQIRMLVVVTFMFGGYMMMSIASTMAGSYGFMVACMASCLVGISQTLGEIGNLSFFRSFPPCILGAWGAGTGLAGISGGSLYVTMRSMDLANQQIFAYMVPTVFMYYGCFYYLYYRANLVGFAREQKSVGESNAQLSIENVKEVGKYTWPILINMVAVYALEYTIYPGLVDRDTICPISSGFLAANAYTLMWTMYNVGVTLSRLSISWFRIDNLWIITALQAINVALWFGEATQHTILNTFGVTGYYILFVWMIWIGLMGGSCYSNCVHAYNTRDNIPDNYRELGVNVGLCFCNIGVLAATNFTTLMQTTFMSTAVLYPNGCPAPRFP